MKRKLISAFILSLLCVTMAMGVAAANTINFAATCDENDPGAINVTGTTGSNRSEYVFAIITDTSTTAADITDATLDDKAYAVGQCISQANGNFEIKGLRLPKRCNDPTYRCIVYTAGGIEIDDFEYESPYETMVEEFTQTVDADDVGEFVVKYSLYLTVSNQDELDEVEENGSMSSVYGLMNNGKAGVATYTDIIELYKEAITAVYNAPSAGTEEDGEEGGDGDNGGNGDGGNGDGGGGFYGGDVGGSDPVVVPIVDNITPKEEKERFSDLAGYAWAKSAIYKLAESGVIAGYPDGRFGPGELLTREQVVVMLVNAYQKATAGDISVFADVKDNAWYADYISYAVGSGMVAGMGDGNFGVGLSITRQDFAVMAYNAMGANYTPSGTANMNDLDAVSGYARKAVEALVEMGVLSGDDNGNVRPKDYTTRAEAAVILSKLR